VGGQVMIYHFVTAADGLVAQWLTSADVEADEYRKVPGQALVPLDEPQPAPVLAVSPGWPCLPVERWRLVQGQVVVEPIP